jgi:mono/diheme cytochrome c family protein
VWARTVPAFFTVAILFLVSCSGAGREKYSMSDAQLGLTPQQAAGRRIYNTACLQCHEAYTSQKRTSVSLQGVLKKPELPSGIPANDARVSEVIVQGKRMMPATPLNDEQLQALLAYLHTL